MPKPMLVWKSKSILAALVVAMVASVTGPASAAFVDVVPGAFYEDAVVWMDEQEITTGTSPTTFEPNADLTRGQAATFIWRFANKPVGSTNPFLDVADGRFYTEAVKWMVDTGITTGTSPTTFSPDDEVTRGQIATFLHRLAGLPAPTVDGDNRVTLAPDCDGTPPPPPPGVGALSVAPASFSLGDLGVGTETTIDVTLTNTGAAGGPALGITEFALDDTDVTTTAGVLALEPGESTVVSLTAKPSSLGADGATLTVRHAGSNGPATTVAISWTGIPGIVHKINAGGPAVADWSADPGPFPATPSPLHNMTDTRNRVVVTSDAISGAGSVPAAVYQSARIDISTSLEMEWDLPVPAAGLYLVRLHFAEIETGFDQQSIDLEGETVLQNFDVGEEAGGSDTALVRSFVVDADATIDLDFRHVYKLNNTQVSGIEVLALGTSPAGYLVASPSYADLGSVATTGGATAPTTITVTNLGASTVTIPSVAAPVGSGFTPDNTGPLVVPAGGSASLAVTFDPSVDGVSTAWLSMAHADPDFGIHLWGHGGVVGQASVLIHELKTNKEVSVFAAGSIAIVNESVDKDITAITIALGDGVGTSYTLLDDLEFDVEDASPISGGEKDFTADFGDITVASSTGADGASSIGTFSGFGPGETLHASIDIDPLSSLGMVDLDHTRTGPVSGLEMVGARITVTFEGGQQVSSPLWTDGSIAGGGVRLSGGAPAAAPTITSLSGGSLPVLDGGSVVFPQPVLSLEVTCVAGQPLALVQIEAVLDMTGAVGAPTPVGGNQSLAYVTPDTPTATCGGGGTASLPVTLVDTNDPLIADPAKDGWNHFMVRQGDPATGPTTVSNRFAVQYVS